MTQPPQQPGPYDPYGQQGGPYGQQPPQSPPYGMPQEPGQYGAPQTPPGGQYGPPSGQFQQPTAQFGPAGYPGYPGGPPGPPPKRRGTGVIIAVIVGAVLVLGGAGTGVYFLVKGSNKTDSSSASGNGGGGTTPSSKRTTPSSGKTTTSEDGPGTTTARPPASGGGGGGGGLNDAAIVDVATKYANAVTNKDENGAKQLTCDNNPGLLFDSGAKVEVTGKPESFGDEGATIAVRVTVGNSPIDDFPLFLNKKGDGWCVQ
jgi:hypothetical protein